MKLSIVLPCYHPPEGWEQRIIAMHRQISETIRQEVQLIIADDGNGSAIPSAKWDTLRAAIPQLKLVSYPENKGKGYALRQGVAEAEGEIILYTDIDFPYTFDSLIALYTRLEQQQCDVAVGIKNKTYYHQVPFVRRVISRNLRFMIRTFLRMQITDTQCGLKGFRKDVKPVFLNTAINRYLFDLEFIHALYNRHTRFRVMPVEVELNPDTVFRRMSYRLLFSELANFLKIAFRKER